MSIQGSIMGVAEPYYLEPGYDKAGDAGEQRSKEYNDNLRYQNMRYAMLGQLQVHKAITTQLDYPQGCF